MPGGAAGAAAAARAVVAGIERVAATDAASIAIAETGFTRDADALR